MNIFALHPNPEIAAKMLCNRHAVKMPTESAGMLSFAFPEGSTPIKNERSNRHYLHPASKWTRSSRENFNWLLEHFKYQLLEYKTRYKREHKYQYLYDWFASNAVELKFENSGLEPFNRCFSDKADIVNSKYTGKTMKDSIMAYRLFYYLDKKDFAKWPSLDHVPVWWPQKSEIFIDKSFKNGYYTKRK